MNSLVYKTVLDGSFAEFPATVKRNFPLYFVNGIKNIFQSKRHAVVFLFLSLLHLASIAENWQWDVREKVGNTHYVSTYCARGLQIPNQSALHMKVPQSNKERRKGASQAWVRTQMSLCSWKKLQTQQLTYETEYCGRFYKVPIQENQENIWPIFYCLYIFKRCASRCLSMTFCVFSVCFWL